MIVSRAGRTQHPELDVKLTELNMDRSQGSSPSRLRRSAAGAGRGVSWVFRTSMKLVLILAFVVIGMFIGGFLQFTNKVSSYEMSDEIPPADAIVVLTGGSTRIARALELLAKKKGQRLLISGVNEGTRAKDLKSINTTNAGLFDCCVDMEHIAKDTIGNAVETSKWMDKLNYKSVIVVTSAYHMPRSLVEFRKRLPDAKLRPYAVPLESINQEGWWRNPDVLRFMLSEYVKYVAANIRSYISTQKFDALRSGLW